jgi:HK97 gp10 family phage protein
VSVRFTVEMDGKDQVLGALRALNIEGRNNVEEVVRLSSRKIRRSARARAPVRSGKFRRAIGTRFSKDGLSANIAAWWRGRGRERVHPLSHIIEFGTAPHKIKPEKRKALALHGKVTGEMGPEQAKFVSSVNHPGTPAQPFLFPAFEEHREGYIRDLREALGKAGRQAAEKWKAHAGRSQTRRNRASLRRAGL